VDFFLYQLKLPESFWLYSHSNHSYRTLAMHFLEQLRHSPYGEKLSEMMGETFKKIFGDFISNAIKKKELVKVPVEVYWSIAFAPLYNLVKFHMAGKSLGGRKFILSDKIMRETFELVLKALKP